MVWTVRWRAGEGSRMREGFWISRSISCSMRWCRLALRWRHLSRIRWLPRLLFAFIGTGSSFLAFAALAAKHNIDNPGYAHKSFYYIGGLTEGTETIVLFVLCCLFPAHFAVFAWIFGALCWLTTTTRIWSGYVTLKSLKP